MFRNRAISSRLRSAFLCCSLMLSLSVGAQGLPQKPPIVLEDEAPRVQALLDQAWAAESGRGLGRDPWLAASLYRQAGALGNAEGYFRAARIHMALWSRGSATCLLAAASALGHRAAGEALEQAGGGVRADCDETLTMPERFTFDMAAYVGGLSMDRQRVAALIRRLAPGYKVEVALALAIASAESNFNTRALSPKMAMGVMQLIPATAERFNVRDPYDPEQNIRGGLAYLRWLKAFFGGDIVRVVAAYNAGEGAVQQHGGIPPYPETRDYVVRVMRYAGHKPETLMERARSLSEMRNMR